MELANVEIVLEKYLNGETSLAEEQQLAMFFSSKEVPEYLSMYKPLFLFFEAEREDVYSKTISIKPRVNYKRWMSVAAIILVTFFGLYSYSLKMKSDQDARLAYSKTKEALNLLSSKFNMGAKQIAHLNEFEDTKNQIFKNH